jgi:hypothetical protein
MAPLLIAIAAVIGVAWIVLELQDNAVRKADPDGGGASGLFWFLVVILLGGVLAALGVWSGEIGRVLSL